MKITNKSHLLFELGVNATFPEDKRLHEKEIKISPFVTLTEVVSNQSGNEKKYFFKNNLTKHELFLNDLDFLSGFNDWVVPDSIIDFEKTENAYYDLLKLYVNEIIETKYNEQAFRFISPYLLNYDLAEEEEYLCYYSNDVEMSVIDAIIAKFKDALHFFKQQEELNLDIIPILIICNSTKEANKFYIETTISNSNWNFCFSTLRRALVIDISKLKDESIESIKFLHEFARSFMHMFFYSDGERLPFWLEYGICNYFTKLYVKDELEYENTQPVRFGDLNIINSSVFSSNTNPDELYDQCLSFTEFLIDVIGYELLFEIIHKIKNIENDFANTLYDLTEISIEDIESFWMIYNNKLFKKYLLIEYKIIEHKYYDEVLYFIQNVNNKLKVEIKDNQLFDISHLKSRTESILKGWNEPAYLYDILKQNKDISFYLQPMLLQLYNLKFIQ